MNDDKHTICNALRSIMEDNACAPDDRISAARELALLTAAYPEPQPPVEERVDRLMETTAALMDKISDQLPAGGFQAASGACFAATIEAHLFYRVVRSLHDLGYEP